MSFVHHSSGLSIWKDLDTPDFTMPPSDRVLPSGAVIEKVPLILYPESVGIIYTSTADISSLKC